MLRKKFFVVAAILGLCLTGCAENDSDVDFYATVAPTVSKTAKPEERACKTLKKNVPLYRNGKKVGHVRINRITKLKFSDFTNKTAVSNGVNYSYSVNVTVSLKDGTNSLTVEPVIKKGKKKISSVASVGWTGFDSKVDIYGGGSTTLESGVQPEENGGDSFSLRFSDGSNREYASVPVSAHLFRKAVNGPGLRSVKNPLRIRSASGAVYAIVPQKVFFENHYLSYKDHDAGTRNFFEIKYKVEARKTPKRASAVQCIHGVGKSSSIECVGVLGLQSPNSSRVLYQAVPQAAWSLWCDNDETGVYVSEGGRPLRFGYQRSVMTNRLAESSERVAPNCVRVRVEFPEEFAACRSLKSKLNCPGRFCVYEMGISERVKKSYY